MHIDTKKRRLKFSVIATIAAALFSLILFTVFSDDLSADFLKLTGMAAVAAGTGAWVSWSLIMRTGETKFRGAWAGLLAVLIAYPIMAVFMTVLDNSSLGAFRYFQITLLLSLSMTGIFTVPLGGFFGHWIARNLKIPESS